MIYNQVISEDLMVSEMTGERISHTSTVIYKMLEDRSKAYLKYEVENGVMKLISTYTPPQHRGKGIAKELVEYAISLAEKNGWKIVPICSYAVHYFMKNPDKRTVLAPSYRELSNEEWSKLFQEALEREKGEQKQ